MDRGFPDDGSYSLIRLKLKGKRGISIHKLMWKVSETQSDTLVVVLEGRRLGTWGARSNDHIDMEVPRSCVLLPFHFRSTTLCVWLGVIIMIGSLRQNFKKNELELFYMNHL